MNAIITSEEQLQAILPNRIPAAHGETPLFERISSYIIHAEKWAVDMFISPLLISAIPERLNSSVERIVGCEALRLAIPALNIILTPNGFATVGTANLVTASKARTDALTKDLIEMRDLAINSFLKSAGSWTDWLETPQAEYFRATLFPNLDLVNSVAYTTELSTWQQYLKLRSQLMDIEMSLAEQYFSQPLLFTLRRCIQCSDLTADRKHVATAIQSQIISYLEKRLFSSNRLCDIVNYIRERPASFPEWHASDTAKLFAPPKFENTKTSSGYFF